MNEVIWDFLSKHNIKKAGLVIKTINALPFTFIFNSEKDAAYYIEVSDDLTEWSKLREIRGDGKQIEVVDSRKAIFQKQYYRLRVALNN